MLVSAQLSPSERKPAFLDGKIHAIEVRVFPAATPDGGRQFAWDLGPDSVMTNATVGTVTKAPEGMVLHVTFKGGESEYSVGPDVPVLANAPGDTSLFEARCGRLRHRAEEAGRQLDIESDLRGEGWIKPPM